MEGSGIIGVQRLVAIGVGYGLDGKALDLSCTDRTFDFDHLRSFTDESVMAL
jgi:hypothetical protein